MDGGKAEMKGGPQELIPSDPQAAMQAVKKAGGLGLRRAVEDINKTWDQQQIRCFLVSPELDQLRRMGLEKPMERPSRPIVTNFQG